MSAGVHELVWAAVLLDGCPNVNGLTLQVQSSAERFGDDCVPVVEVDVHAASHADAETLAASLRLGEVEGRVTASSLGGTLVWRNWARWAADGSREAAVWVTVTGADLVAGQAVA